MEKNYESPRASKDFNNSVSKIIMIKFLFTSISTFPKAILNKSDIFECGNVVLSPCRPIIEFAAKNSNFVIFGYLRLEQIQNRLDGNLIILFAHAISIFHNHEVR